MKLFDKDWWLQQLHKEHIIELNELQVNKPNITWEDLYKYCEENIIGNDNAFNMNGEGWREYIEITKKYSNNQDFLLFENDFKYLTPIQCNKLYKELQQLFQKYSHINELEINNPQQQFLKKLLEHPEFDEHCVWAGSWKDGLQDDKGKIITKDSPNCIWNDTVKRYQTPQEAFKWLNTLNELSVNKPKQYIPIVKPTKPEYITSKENFKKLTNYFENTNLKLQKEIGRLELINDDEVKGIAFPLTIDIASKKIFQRWLFENVKNYYSTKHFEIFNKWWNGSRICLEDLEENKINELSVNKPLKFPIRIPEQWNEKGIENVIEAEQLFNDFAKINPNLFKYIDLEYIIKWLLLDKYPTTVNLFLCSNISDAIWVYFGLNLRDSNIEWTHFNSLIVKQWDNRLIDFNEIESTFNIKKPVNELQINKPIKTWDFSKYIPNFDPNKIQIGDNIIFSGKITDMFNGEVINVWHHKDPEDSRFELKPQHYISGKYLIDLNNQKKPKLNESKQPIKDSFKEFIKFLQQELPIKEKYNIKLTKDKSKTTSFAHFNPSNNEIVVYIKGRNLMDSFRSLAHEWRHLYQNINNELTNTSGEDGSEHENEANAFAGLVMRKWGKLHPEYYTQLVENKIHELGINKPNATVEEVQDYYMLHLLYPHPEDSEIWQEYEKICKPYCEKYDIVQWVGRYHFKVLSQQELNKLYSQMKQLVQKYSNINELQVNRPPRTWDLTKQGVKYENIQVGDILQFIVNPGPETVRQKVIKKSNSVYMQTQDLDKDGNLKPNAMDQWDVWGIEDNWKKKSIHELEVNNPNVTWQKVYDFFDENINISYVGEKSDIWSNIWDEFKEFSAPYDEKYPTDDWRKFFQLFTRSDLNKFYQGMKQIYNKYNNLNESKSQNKNEIFSAYHGRYKFDVSKAYDLIKQGDIKTKIKTYPPEVMHFLSHPEFSEANPEKYNQININYNEPLGLIANFKDENDKNELMLIDGNHRTRKAVGEKQEGKYIVMYDPNDVSKILTINNEIPKKLFSDDE